MKLSRCILLSLAAAMSTQADLTVVSGNVYDVGKYSFCQDAAGDTDSAMCWAAAAANVIQHWQDTYKTFADTPQLIPDGTQNTSYNYPRGTGELNVYSAIMNGWDAGSGVPCNAISWWMQGPTRSSGATGGRYEPVGATLQNQFSGAGYYKKLFGNVSSFQLPVYPVLTNAPFYSLQIAKFGTESTSPQLADIRTTLTDAFKVQGQAVSLLVQPEKGSGHAISCWGYETNESGVITSLILSDSDDRKFGTFIVNLTEAADGTATIQTDRYNSWYHGGDYAIKDVIYIITPEKTPVEIGSIAAGTAVAKAREAQAEITGLSASITNSCRLIQSVETATHVTIGGGTYGTGADEAVIFTTAENASISINDSANDGALLTVADGGMALLYGGLSLQGGTSNCAQGAEVLGHLYVHGGDMEISRCNAYEEHAGAALHGGVLDDYGSLQTDGVFATSYIEVRHAGEVSIHDNASTVVSATFIGGGAVSAEDSFSFRDNASVVVNDNSIQGRFVYGGGAFAHMEATLSGNTSLEMSGNTAQSTSCLAEGGALAALFTNVCGNGDVSFTGNKAMADNDGKYAAGYPDPATGAYTWGANGRGGAVAVTFPSAISDTKGNYMPAELHMDGNGSVTFSQNLAEASFSDTNSYSAYASGGALYVGNLQHPPKAPMGAVASISGNTKGVTFDSNQALADSHRLSDGRANGVARGGAAYVAEKASLSIDHNKGGVTFSNNSAAGSEVSQGGGIYNAGELVLSHNDAVTFSDNTAAEGSHLYNAMGATAEIAWNGSVLFSGETEDTSTVVNKGTMYLAAEAGQSIEFHNTTLDTTEGTLHLGKDAADNQHATTLSFTGNSAATNVSSLSGISTELSSLSLSLNSISSKQGEMVFVDNLNVSTDTGLVVNGLVLGSNVQLAETDKDHALTLSNVVVDLGKTKYTVQKNDCDGKNYIFDLQSMLSGNITLSGITFDASDLSDTLDFANDDRVCMMFGDVNFTQKDGTPITLSYVGQGGTIIQPYKLIDGSNVYFGEYFEVPEPATGTLSLLALTLLAARRRRK